MGNRTFAFFTDMFDDTVLAEGVVAFIGKGIEDYLVT
jgi:hypothetical protein